MPQIQSVMEYKPIYNKLAIVDQEIAASGTYTTSAIDVSSGFGTFGYNAFQLIVTGDGELKVEYLVSADNTNFITPSGASAVVTAFTKTSGSGSDGKDYVTLSLPLCKYFKLKFTETGTSDTVTVNAIILSK